MSEEVEITLVYETGTQSSQKAISNGPDDIERYLNAVNNDDVVLVVVRRTSDNEVLGERRRRSTDTQGLARKSRITAFRKRRCSKPAVPLSGLRRLQGQG
jgi:hypothetical protein